MWEPTLPHPKSSWSATPSVVSFQKDGELVVGKAAKNRAVTNPENTIASIKRFIGRNYSETASERGTVAYNIKNGKDGRNMVDIDGKEYTPEETKEQKRREWEAKNPDWQTFELRPVKAYYNETTNYYGQTVRTLIGLPADREPAQKVRPLCLLSTALRNQLMSSSQVTIRGKPRIGNGGSSG